MRQFNVSEARTAIACPRIFYFDHQRAQAQPTKVKKITRIWTGEAGGESACGALFHNTVERFNRLARKAPEVLAALEAAAGPADAGEAARRLFEEFKRFINRDCLNREALGKKSVPQTLAFIKSLDLYVRDLAEVLTYSVRHRRPPAELIDEFFGDSRKRVDVTVEFGEELDSVHIRGILDYIYFDWREGRERIVDYKLIPATQPSKDLMQVSLYALMHHQQHNTEPDVAVYYLFPEKKIASHTWNQIRQLREVIYGLLASMVEWQDFDESTGRGLKPPGSPVMCATCPWNKQCERRLGPIAEGGHSTRWKEIRDRRHVDPRVEAHKPPDVGPEIEFEDPTEADQSNPHSAPAAAVDCLQLGATFGDPRPIEPPLTILPTHVAVLGAAGSGKTWLAKVVAEECVRNGVPTLAIDPQGDLVQFLKPATPDDKWSAEERRLQREYLDRVEPRIWTPGSSHARRLCLSPLRLPKESDLAGFDNPDRRREEWDALLGVAAGNLVRLADAGGDEELQQTFLLELLRALSQTRAGQGLGLNDIVAAIAAPDSLGIDDPDAILSKTQREKLRQRLYSRMRGATANLFSGGTSLNLDDFVRPATPGKTPLNIVYLNALPDDAQKQFFVAALAAEVYRWMITSASTGATRLLFYLDEARDFLPAGTAKPPAKPPLLRLFAQGRKFGVSCLVCTQSPRSVDYNVFTNASTKFIGRLEAAQDVERVADWFSAGGPKPSWLGGRTGAAKGSFVGRWPEIPAELDGVEFRSRKLYSLHEGAWSPERVEREWAEYAARANA